MPMLTRSGVETTPGPQLGHDAAIDVAALPRADLLAIHADTLAAGFRTLSAARRLARSQVV